MSSVKMMHYGINEKINLMITIVTDISQVTVCSKCSGYSSSSGQALDRMEQVVCHFFFQSRSRYNYSTSNLSIEIWRFIVMCQV